MEYLENNRYKRTLTDRDRVVNDAQELANRLETTLFVIWDPKVRSYVITDNSEAQGITALIDPD